MISLELYGDPVPLARPRFSSRGRFVKAYDSQSALKDGFKWQIKSQYREAALTTPITLDVVFFMPIPKSASGIQKRQMANGVISHIKKPDLDNLIKLIADCLIGTVIEDDSIIERIVATKKYSNNPGTLVRIYAQPQIGALYEDNKIRSRK